MKLHGSSVCLEEQLITALQNSNTAWSTPIPMANKGDTMQLAIGDLAETSPSKKNEKWFMVVES